ncbi:protoporphyrinogen oxidase [Pelobacter propionicus]|uniref:Coproporphyrinogen III oxidase n=1 Tax=Pelobacter propionicus (strain DSM 2379 / NBRC 103807 / OttBd1) TaxID=338966 RepID=A1AJY5_PELPD|nr:protoporphyrinogen oxidase [Pelobacter propionicus]ABK97655.1 protoporphyrinogen oxidase [Pelobacter propionicus DSM 2379]
MKRAIIVGGGISGLATAWLLREKALACGIQLELVLLEKDQRPGGKIRSIHEGGYVCEWGPNGFLDSKPQTLELCDAVGVSSDLLRSNDNARKRFIYSDGELHRLPEGGGTFLKSRLISWPGKLRLALEPTPFIARTPAGVDESLADFARRRLGGEALDKLISPMVSGIFAGDPETMSLVSCFPRIAQLEREYGGLIRAMVRLARQKKRERAAGKAVSSAAGPGGVLTSFRPGIQYLTDSLAASLGGIVMADREVSWVRRGKSAAWRVGCRDGGEYDADLVIVASPAHAASAILHDCDAGIASILESIPYASMTVVCLGYERELVSHPLDGFGYLIPKKEGRSILGTLWDSSMFENRAPTGKVLLRSMVGGACFPDYVHMGDDELLGRVRGDMKDVMGIVAEPSFIRIFRHPQAIPQYTVGHGERLKHLEERLACHPGLILTGNSYRGIGLNDCVAAAQRASDQALELLR